jgi:hypothetical protein
VDRLRRRSNPFAFAAQLLDPSTGRDRGGQGVASVAESWPGRGLYPAWLSLTPSRQPLFPTSIGRDGGAGVSLPIRRSGTSRFGPFRRGLKPKPTPIGSSRSSTPHGPLNLSRIWNRLRLRHPNSPQDGSPTDAKLGGNRGLAHVTKHDRSAKAPKALVVTIPLTLCAARDAVIEGRPLMQDHGTPVARVVKLAI